MIFVRNILRNKSRCLLTLLGVAAGLSFYLSITAITHNLNRELSEVLSGYSTDITVLSKRAASSFSSRIRANDYAELQAYLGDSVSPLVIGSLREEWNPYAMVLGTSHWTTSRFGLLEGRFPTDGKQEVVIGTLLANQIGVTVGQALTLSNSQYRITGIHGSGSRLIDGSVLMNLNEAQQLFGREQQINIALVRVQKSGDIQQIIQQINARFPKLKASQSSDFLRNSRLFIVATSCSQAVAVISFIGTCLIVTNTMLMAVGERTKEIGILMAIGWRPHLVLRMLFAESLTICLSGALLGNCLAIGILRILNYSKVIGFGWIPTTLPVESVALSLGMALLLACTAILWPAAIIYNLTPLEALRHE